jgi:hypothetical protein
MKNYLIIIHDYSGIGGAQLYAIRRANYLIENGYAVNFLVSHFDDSKIGKPKEVNIYYNKYLNIPTVCLSKHIIDKEVESFISNLKDFNNLIIETFSKEACTWGELIAKNLGVKHIIYSLGEQCLDQIRYKYFLDFFLFKYYRGELLGLSDCSLKIILGRHFQNKNNYFVNIPFDASEISSTTSPQFLNKVNLNSFRIGTLSRLEKEYVIVLVEQVIKIALKYPEIKFSLLVCGEGVKKGYNSVDFINKYSNSNDKPRNLDFLFPGYTFPVGKDFFQSLDVFVGMGTAAVSSISQGCATICVDPRVNRSIGTFGVQTNNFAYSINNTYFDIHVSIEELLIDRNKLKNAKTKGYKLFVKDFENKPCMKKIDMYIQNSSKTKNYFYENQNIFFLKLKIFLIRSTYFLLSSKFLVTIYKRINFISVSK